jgi:protein-tyrosine phosphatase
LNAAAERRPWRLALLWLAVLGPFFFVSYNFANWLTGLRHGVPELMFAWERRIPFLAWTIVPYWSTDPFYGVSLFLCRTRVELNTLGRRLLTVQVLCVAGFLLAPLQFSVARPHADGLFGRLFDALMVFDKPFNQAPSLHIAIVTVLWVAYGRHVHGVALRLIQGWFLLMAVSTMTTYQHHFIDLPTGLWVGLFALALFPDISRSSGRPAPQSSLAPTKTGVEALWNRERERAARSTDEATAASRFLQRMRVQFLVGPLPAVAVPGGTAGADLRRWEWIGAGVRQSDPVRLWIGAGYLACAAICGLLAWRLGGAAWILLWPAGATAIVAIVYWSGRPELFRKSQGRMPRAAIAILAPYLAGTWLNMRLRTMGQPAAQAIADGVWLGRMPRPEELRTAGMASLVDLTAEWPCADPGVEYRGIPMIDLLAPGAEQLDAAVDAIESLRGARPTWVCCALGYSRSAAAMAAWLIASGKADSADQAIAFVRARRPYIILRPGFRAAIEQWAAARATR